MTDITILIKLCCVCAVQCEKEQLLHLLNYDLQHQKLLHDWQGEGTPFQRVSILYLCLACQGLAAGDVTAEVHLLKAGIGERRTLFNLYCSTVQ